MTTSAFKFFLLLTAVIFSAESAKFLSFIVPAVSHFRESNSVAVELLNRGHKVDLLFDECFKKHVTDTRYNKLHFYPCSNLDKVMGDAKKFKEMMANMFVKSSNQPEIFTLYSMLKDTQFAFESLCNTTIGNKDFLEKLKKENYDYLLIDGSAVAMCMYLLPDYLGVPHVTVSSHIELRATRLNQPFIDTATSSGISGRLGNFLEAVFFEHVHLWLYDYNKYRKQVGYNYRNPEIVAEKSELWILNQDFLLQPPKSLPPHVRLVGGLSLAEPRLLKDEFKTFAEKSSQGFIVLTFGSMTAFLPEIVASKFAEAFNKIPFNVVMRLKGEEVGLFKNHKNVLIRPWLPQNDLLAHPNCRLFISHCGNNGNYEALYNGVPVIGLPLFGDQGQNAQRLEDRGYGIKMNLADLTAKTFASNIIKVASENSSYKKQIAAASKIYRRKRPAVKRAADAMEEALRGETRFYFPEKSYQLTALQYNNVDLVIVVFLILLIVVGLCVTCCCYCVKKCIKRRNKQKND